MKSFSWQDLPVNNALGLTKGGKIHLRIHTGKLSNDILKPLTISVNDIVCELLLCLFKGLNRLSQGLSFHSQFALNLPQKDLALRGPLLQFGDFVLQLRHQIFKLDRTGTEREDFRF